MRSDPSPCCPLADSSAPATGQVAVHARRWELADSYKALCPLPPSEKSDLTAGARLAWKNAVRCIGRPLWNSLKVIDARHVETHDEIFEVLRQHLLNATNGGSIASVMSVFREWLPNGQDLRIWNHQLLRYAGYASADGSILGDPMNLRLTEVALSLGWRPPSERGAFDLLPVIIQVGDRLRWFEFSRKEVLEVKIRHPEHPFIENMNLRWYAVPAVSDMMFATGSEVYACAPFNGYYMGTEIGARNFGDAGRYNLLPVVAEALGLDVKRRRSLWKDRALLLLNEAVLWSFDAEGVRIADHHSASDTFTRFCKREENAGRAVNAEWSWIVPPVSGSATSVYHQEYQLEPQFPNFLLRDAPWDTSEGRRILSENSRRAGR